MKKLVLSIFALGLIFVSCSDDDNDSLDDTMVEVEEEVITDVEVTLVNDITDEEVVLVFEDADGIGVGENGMVVSGGTLDANSTYTGSFLITNALEDEDITEEIEEFQDEHQFFFISDDDLASVESEYNDMDSNGYPVGLDFTITTTDAATGILRIVLRHEPNKSAEGVSDGDITNEDSGSSDFDIDFPITVEESMM